MPAKELKSAQVFATAVETPEEGAVPAVSKGDWKSEIELAMRAWEAAFAENWPGLTVTFAPAEYSNPDPGEDRADELTNEIAWTDTIDIPSEDHGIGDIRIGMRAMAEAILGKSTKPVATQVSLNEVSNRAGDIFFNPTASWRKNSTVPIEHELEAYSIAVLACHELGHSLGIAHNRFGEIPPPNNPIMSANKQMVDQLVLQAADKTCLKDKYSGTSSTSNPCGQYGGEKKYWPKIKEAVDAVEAGGTASVTIWYSYMIDETPIYTPETLPNCCICCGRVQSNQSWGKGCYCGCCACPPEGSLTFRMTACETEAGPCSSFGEGKSNMEFDLTKRDDECFITQQEGNLDDADWVCRSYESVYEGHGHSSGIEYTDPDTTGQFPEAWGFSGTVCGGDITTPIMPAYTTAGECLGQGIIASLCCCKTGTTSNYLIDPKYPTERVNPGADGLWSCEGREFYGPGSLVRTGVYWETTYGYDPSYITNPIWAFVSEDTRSYAVCASQGFKAGAPYPIWWEKLDDKLYPSGHPCPPPTRADGLLSSCPDGNSTIDNAQCSDAPLDCSMQCFTFTIQPDETRYEYTYLQPVETGTCDDGYYGQYGMETGTGHSACSPCVHKIGKCKFAFGEVCDTFDPTIIDQGTFTAASVGSSTITKDKGQHWIISGQCPDHAKEDPKYFRLMVGGAWTMHCDCQTGVLTDCGTNNCRNHCDSDCLGDWDIVDAGPRLKNATWPCSPVLTPDDCTEAIGMEDCHWLDGWGELEWDDDLYGGDCWYHNCLDTDSDAGCCKSGESAKGNYGMMFCGKDEENDCCASFCEHNTPVIMWYTGIIEGGDEGSATEITKGIGFS